MMKASERKKQERDGRKEEEFKIPWRWEQDIRLKLTVAGEDYKGNNGCFFY
jgi:hypothetical protein